jgi:hypothetical protein
MRTSDVTWRMGNDVSGELPYSKYIQGVLRPEDGGSRFLRTVGNYHVPKRRCLDAVKNRNTAQAKGWTTRKSKFDYEHGHRFISSPQPAHCVRVPHSPVYRKWSGHDAISTNAEGKVGEVIPPLFNTSFWRHG